MRNFCDGAIVQADRGHGPDRVLPSFIARFRQMQMEVAPEVAEAAAQQEQDAHEADTNMAPQWRTA
jgi:hypothetical protein